MFATVATIISGLVSIAGSIYAGNKQNEEIERASDKQYGLALIARQDQKESEAKYYGLKQEELGIVKRKNSFEQQQQKKLMRQQQLLNLGSSLDSLSKKDQNMTNFVLSLYGKNAYNSKGIGV